MSVLRVEWVLLDIEGTTSNLAFVHEVLFPYARERMGGFLAERVGDPQILCALDQVARDAGGQVARDWCPHPLETPEGIGWIVAHLHGLMDRDAKATGLKQLQGMIWERGFRDGTLRSHVFDDVPGMLDRWRQMGLGLAIYSSGSVAAQKLYFGHTVAGDLSEYFVRHFDTTVGTKRETASYSSIAKLLGVQTCDVLFVSDVPEELDAAGSAGFQTALAVRPGNRSATGCRHRRVRDFTELALERLRDGA